MDDIDTLQFLVFFVMAILIGSYVCYKASGRLLTAIGNNDWFSVIMFGIIMIINGIGLAATGFMAMMVSVKLLSALIK